MSTFLKYMDKFNNIYSMQTYFLDSFSNTSSPLPQILPLEKGRTSRPSFMKYGFKASKRQTLKSQSVDNPSQVR